MEQGIAGSDDELAFMVKVGEIGQTEAVVATRAALDPDSEPLIRPPEIIHATVLHIGPASLERAPAVARSLAPLVRLPGFTIVFDRCEWRPHPRHTPNGIALLLASEIPAVWRLLRDQLSEIPRRLGQRKTSGEQPHLTMAYDCPPFAAIALESPVIWHVTSFQLIRIAKRPVRHHEIARWDLT